MRYVLAALILFTVIGAFIVACRDDVVVEPPPPILGEYTGIYAYKLVGQVPTEQHIFWSFDADKFLMTMDSTFHQESGRAFCDVEGAYILGSQIELYVPTVPGRTPESFTNRTGKVCTPELGPWGRFAVDQSQENRVVLTRSSASDSVLQTITLYRR